MTLLELERVHAGYGDEDVLKDVSLRVESGEIVALIGANGAGKTTTIRVVSGLLRPRTGRVIFAGEPRSRLGADQAAHRGIALVPEGRRIFHGMTVEENIELGALKDRLFKTGRPDIALAYSIFLGLPSGTGRAPGACRAESSRCSPWHGPLLAARAFSCWTSRRSGSHP